MSRIFVLVVFAVVASSGVLACGSGTPPHPAAAPLPSLSQGDPTPPSGRGELWAGVGREKDVYFGSQTDHVGITVDVLRAQWRQEQLESIDGRKHDEVLSVAVRVTNTGRETWSVDLSGQAEVELSDGTTLRSGQAPTPFAFGEVDLKPGETRVGWFVFENVDWEALRGNTVPAESRLRLYVPLGSGLGRGEWLVDADGQDEGTVRKVHLMALGAWVTFLID